MTDWIKHDGKGMPVDGMTSVDVRFKSGTERTGRARRWNTRYSQWRHYGDGFDIVAYRVHTPASEVSA